MSTLGKILAVFNILAAIGFVYLVAADWGRRQGWAYTVLLYDLRMRGIPVDAEEDNRVEQRKWVELAEPALPDIFKGVPGNQVTTQEEEVGNVKTALTKELVALQGDPKRKKLAAILIPLATTSGARDRLARQIATEATDLLMDERGPFQQAFSRIPAGKEPDREVKRQAIAELLFGLATKDSADAWAVVDVPNPDPNKPPQQNQMMRCTRDTPPDPAWLQRVVTIVGTHEFAMAANRQALALREMITPVRVAMAGDLGAFVDQHNTLTKILRQLSAELTDRRADLAARTAEMAKHQGIVASRKTDLDTLKDQLEETRKVVVAALNAQHALEDRLFQASRATRDGQATNEKLEREIRRRENAATK
jgi:hypothetical protein